MWKDPCYMHNDAVPLVTGYLVVGVCLGGGVGGGVGGMASGNKSAQVAQRLRQQQMFEIDSDW